MNLRTLRATTLNLLLRYCKNYFCRQQSYFLPSMASGKLDTPHFHAILTPDLLRLGQLFKSEGYSLRLVGGVVRDLLLGCKPKDVDLATECTPDEMIRLFEREGIRHIPTGLQHGTITAHINNVDYEITTLRVDHLTDGRHAVVEFTSDWKTDAERRDLTINAMSLNFDGVLYDYFDGQRHLAEHKICFVGDSRSRIKEDYLRILRYFRFYGRIALSPDGHDADTLAAIKETAEGLSGISVERVWMEMKRILVGRHTPHLINLMYQVGVAHYINLPSDGNLQELTNVWKRMQGRYHLQPVSVLVSLTHTSQEAEELGRRWKLSNTERKLGIFVAEQREKGYQDTPLKYYQDLLVDGVSLEHITEVLRYCGRVEQASELERWTVPIFPLNGKHLAAVGLTAGPQMGRVLKMAKEKWKDSFYTLNKEELLEMTVKNCR